MHSKAFFCIASLLVHLSIIPASSSSQHQLEPSFLNNLYPTHTPVVAASPLDAPRTPERSRLVSHSIPALAAAMGYAAGHLTVRQLMQQPNCYAPLLGGTTTALLTAGLIAGISEFSTSEAQPDIVISEPSAPADHQTELAHLQSELARLNLFLSDEIIKADRSYAQHKFYMQWQQVADAVETSLDAQEDDKDALEQPLINFLPEELLRFIITNEDPTSSSTPIAFEDEEWVAVTPDDRIDHVAAIDAYAQAAALHRKEQAQNRAKQVMKRLVQIKNNAPNYIQQ